MTCATYTGLSGPPKTDLCSHYDVPSNKATQTSKFYTCIEVFYLNSAHKNHQIFIIVSKHSELKFDSIRFEFSKATDTFIPIWNDENAEGEGLVPLSESCLSFSPPLPHTHTHTHRERERGIYYWPFQGGTSAVVH